VTDQRNPLTGERVERVRVGEQIDFVRASVEQPGVQPRQRFVDVAGWTISSVTPGGSAWTIAQHLGGQHTGVRAADEARIPDTRASRLAVVTPRPGSMAAFISAWFAPSLLRRVTETFGRRSEQHQKSEIARPDVSRLEDRR
jgi:hypothetical protein